MNTMASASHADPKADPDEQLRVLDDLRQRAGWPDFIPNPDAPVRGRPADGLELALAGMGTSEGPFVVLEVGAELGGSTRRFLDAGSNVWVVSVDPWPDDYPLPWPELRPFIGGDGSMLRLYQSLCWKYRDRLIPWRGVAPSAVVDLARAGLVPDVVYIDGDHRYDAVFSDLVICDALFGSSLLTGDDWDFSPRSFKYEGMTYPVRYAVQAFCAYKGYEVTSRGNTWGIRRHSASTAAATLTRRFGPQADRQSETELADLLRQSMADLRTELSRRDASVVALQRDVADLRADLNRVLAGQFDARPKRPRWQRRLAKLRRDPARFIKDSWPVRALSGRRRPNDS